MRTVAILIFSLFITLNANSALALTCKSGTADCTQSSNTASDCTALGYTNANTANCKHYLYCPFNTAYKACVAVTDSEPEPDCSDYPLTACPEHSICDKCPDDETYKKLTGCETGYTLNASGTGCILSTCPTGYAKTADDCYNKGSAGWSLDLTDKYDSTDCYKCIAKSCEAGYSTDITSIADCGTTGSAGYTFTKSESGYSGDDACGKCECTDPCEDTYTGEIPENAHAVTEACKACDKEKDIVTDWACDDGYVINSAKTGCIPSTCPTGYAKTADDCYNKGSAGWSLDLTDKYDSTDCYKCIAKSCEAGYSTDITSIADCGTTGSAGYTFTKSESGYSGDDACGKCECTDPCEDTYTGEIPENAHAVTEACKACDKEKDIVTDWACDDGYVINSAKTGCIPSTCPTGYAKVASECSASGSGAWHLDMNNRYDSTDCYKCEPDACKGESSTTITISQCGNKGIGDKGWFVSETGYSGEDKCYTCEKLACEGDYSTDVTTCEAGYELVTKDYSGDDACGKCKEKDCSTGYSKSITSEANCSAGYEFEQEPGNPLCGKCNVKPCETGYSTDVTTCEAGYEIVTNGYSGEQECKKCDKSPCSAGYSDTITSETDCSAGYSFKQDPDNPLCGMCEEKSCPSGSYATSELCEAAKPNPDALCVENPITGCWKPKTLISGCLPGTYETKAECINKEKVWSCTKNSFGCWEPDSNLICLRGTYATEEECINIEKALKCVQNSTGCWEPETIQCFYTLTSCPAHGTCNSCTDSSGTRYDLTSCDTDYYMSGTTCLSCAGAYKTMKDLNDKANNSYLNCCSGGVASPCRNRKTCRSVDKGSWNDGCIPTYAATYDDFADFKANCVKSIDDIADTITDFNAKCPNYKISNIVSSTIQCGNVIDNGLPAKPVEDGTNFGCSN